MATDEFVKGRKPGGGNEKGFVFGRRPGSGGGGLQAEIFDRLNSKQAPMSSLVMKNRTSTEILTIPEGVDLRFFNCDVTGIIFEGKSAVYLENCKVDYLKFTNSSFLAFEGCQFKKIVMDGSYGEINGKPGQNGTDSTKIKDTMELTNQSFLDIKHTEFTNLSKIMDAEDSEIRFYYCKYYEIPEGMHAYRCTIRISTCLFRTVERNLDVEDHSSLWISDSEISSRHKQAVRIKNKSVGWISESGDGQYPGAINVLMGGVAVLDVTNSRVFLKDTILKGLEWLDHSIWCKAGGYVECKGINNPNIFMESGALPGIACTGYGSKVLVEDYRYIKCGENYAIKCTDYGTVICRNVREEITSETDDAIYIEDFGKVEVYNTALINGKGNNGVWARYGSKFIGEMISDKILGDANDGIKLEFNSKAYCREVELIHGVALNGVEMEEDCLFQGVGVVLIKGDGLNGIHSKTRSTHSCKTGTKIEGVGLHGIQMEDSCKGYCRDIEKIHGNAVHGIDMKTRCTLMCVNIDEIHGLGTHGINMEELCRCKVVESKEIIGLGTHGVNMKDRCFLTVREVELIKGTGADGIHAEDNCKIFHKEVIDTIGEGDNGIYMTSGCTLKAYDGTKIEGTATDGIQAVTGNTISVKNFQDIVGGGRDGFHCEDDNKLSTRKITKVEAARDGYYMEDNCEFSALGIVEIEAGRHGFYGKTEIYGKYERSGLINAGEDGLHFESKCELHAKVVDSITGGSHPVYLKEYARLTTHKVILYTGPEVYVEDHSQFLLEESELVCKLRAVTNCIISLTFNKITDTVDISDKCTVYLDTWVFEATFDIEDTCEVDGRDITFKDAVHGLNNISLELDHAIFESTVNWETDCRIDGHDHDYRSTLTDTESKYEVSKMLVASTWSSTRSERTVTDLEVTGAVTFTDTNINGACRLDHVKLSANLTLTNGTHRISSFDMMDCIFSGDGYVELSSGSAGAFQATGGKATARANSCELGELTAVNAGVFINSAAIGTVTLTSCGCVAQNPDIGSMSLSSSGLLSSAGEISSCACADSVAEWMGTAGTLTGNSKSIPGAAGRVIRYATGELEENFGKTSKRWFDVDLVERVQENRIIDIFGTDILRVASTIEQHAGTSHTVKSPDIIETNGPSSPVEPGAP